MWFFSPAVLIVSLGVFQSLVWANPLKHAAGKTGAVASESKVCSTIGADVLKEGGNAADALIAMQFCVGVIGMYHSGLGGGGFMVVRAKNGSYEFVDFREMAPAASTTNMYVNNTNLSLYGGLASGVPGELRGLEHLYKNYASMPWKKLLQPAIKVARYGFPVTADLVRYMAGVVTPYDFLTYDETWAIDFAPNGIRVGLGDIMTRKRYANTLESIAEQGPNVFYSGAIANATITALAKSGGIMTLADLKNYSVAIREPSQITYRGYKVHTGSAPSSGAVVCSILKIVEGYDMSTPSLLNLSTHYLDEGFRFAYGQRSLLGDPSFLPNLTSYQHGMYSSATAAEVRSKIEPDHTLNTTVYNPSNYAILQDAGTSATVAADKSGLTIAVTSTINTIFGSRLMVPETGVIMNNEMNDFSIPNTVNAFGYPPSPANFIMPFKRPLSSISPTIVEHANGTVYVSHASAGGSRIITEVVQHLWHVLDQNMTSAQALAMPRMHDQLSPDLVSFEWGSDVGVAGMGGKVKRGEMKGIMGYSNATTAYFRSIGAKVGFVAPGSTTAQGLRRLGDGMFEAAGEPRQMNSAGIVV